jgi:hypothetical protein
MNDRLVNSCSDEQLLTMAIYCPNSLGLEFTNRQKIIEG